MDIKRLLSHGNKARRFIIAVTGTDARPRRLKDVQIKVYGSGSENLFGLRGRPQCHIRGSAQEVKPGYRTTPYRA